MNSPSNTNNSHATTPVSGHHHQSDEQLFGSDSSLSQQIVNNVEHGFDDMELDSQVSDDLNVRHSDNAHGKALDEKIILHEGKRSEYERLYHQLNDEYDELMGLPFSDDTVEQAKLEAKMNFLQAKVSNLEKRMHSASQLIASLKDEKFKSIALEKQQYDTDGNISTKHPWTKVLEKDLPIFNVTPFYEGKLLLNDGSNSTNTYVDLRNGEKSLNSFITKFERAFAYKNVSVHKFWSRHLEFCLHKNPIAMSWYVQFIKNPMHLQKKHISWDSAKKLMRDRFDIAENLEFMYCNEYLTKIKQGNKESVVAYVDRFGSYLAGAKINTGDCLFIVLYFISSLYGYVGLKEKIHQVLKDEYLEDLIRKNSLGTSSDSKYADSMDKYIPRNFLEFSSIIHKHFRQFDSLVSEKKELPKNDGQSGSSSSPSLVSSSDGSKNNKKRKFLSNDNSSTEKTTKPSGTVEELSKLLSLMDVSKSLSKEDKDLLVKHGHCRYCRVSKYSFAHGQSCSARKEHVNKVNNNRPSSQNTIDNVKNTDSNVFYSSIKKTNASSSFVVDSSDSDSDSSVNEFQNALAQYDQSLLDGTYDNDDNKKVYCISKYTESVDKKVLTSSLTSTIPKKRNVIGDVNNPFETNNAAYAPVSYITVNSINTLCLFDTGAEVSIISKDFAKKHNIAFQSIPGSLCVADGKRIPRQQTTKFLSVDYSGVAKTIPHKFDVIDNEQLVKEGKIIVGCDLLPKLNVYLTNVAYKFKSSSKIDDSIDDKPYEPNVTPYGSDREQKAFFTALEPYIEANKNLKPDSLCNLPESVLYLPTPDGYHVNVKQYQIAYSDQPKVMVIINEWLEAGIITKAEPSEWNLPITVTPKKDLNGNKTDLIRVVLDTRLLNKALPVINETLPLIADIYHAMAGSKVFSTIDLKSAFSQFRVNPADQKKTSFTAPNGLKYMHVGSPFGVSTISQLFSRVMLTLFQDMKFVKCFVDDICIFSQSIEAHFIHVKEVIKILTQANLRINFDKSHFAKAEVYLLGFSISEHGRRIDKRKLTNIMDWPRPKNSKQCAAFLGFVNYFRQHLPNVAKLMAKLDTLRSFDALNKKSKRSFEWTDVHEHDFIALKDILASDILLSHPNHNHPFCIATDASNYAIGCCLYQEYKEITADGDEKVIVKYIGFFSRKLSKSEQNYSTTMRELLAIIYALKQFHKFVWNVHFTVFCDHKAISYAHNQKNANSMIIKWLDVFLDYDFSVVYRKGMDNILPDLLSRLFEPDNIENVDTDKVARQKRILITNKNHAISDELNGKKQKLIVETENKKIFCVAKANEDTVSQTGDVNYYDIKLTNAIKSSILETKKIFYVQSSQTMYSDYVIPPEAEHNELLEKAHNEVGHYGAEQMVKRLHDQGIHWPNLIQSCIQYVRKCIDCQRHNIEKRGYHPARNLYSYVPGDHFAIDLGGPISTSEKHNYNYFLVLICVCTRFCILRPLTDKKSDTVLKTLIDIFSIFGPPLVLSSDNGKEFSNTLSADLANALGYDHRFITPLHASANGISERLVQEVKRGLAKATHGVGQDWSLKLNAVQLALNNRISKKLNSTPFSLMFARKMIEPYGFKADHERVSKPENRTPMSHEELMKRIDYMADIVFPAIVAKTQAQVELEEAKFNQKHRMVDYKPGDHVMIRVTTKLGQLAPSYEGPFTVVRKTQGNSYVLRDETGVLSPRNYTSTELKLISKDEVIELDDEGNEIKHFEVDSILNHRGDMQNREYLIRWKNYGSEYDEWVSASDMNATALIRNYYKKLGISYQPKKGQKDTISPTSSAVLKSNPPGSISTIIESIGTDPFNDSAAISNNSRSKKRTSVTTGSHSNTKRTRKSYHASKRRI